MTKRVFSAGLAWSVIEAKWPGFEEAFQGFVPAPLAFEPDDYWDSLDRDGRIVRNGAKIRSVRRNAAFVASNHQGSRKLQERFWRAGRHRTRSASSTSRQAGRAGSGACRARCASNSWARTDSRPPGTSSPACATPASRSRRSKSKGDLQRVQAQFNAWAEETGLPYLHLSRICAYSTGENHGAAPPTGSGG